MNRDEHHDDRSFPQTRWTLVELAASTGPGHAGADALETLLRRYLPALRAYLAHAKHMKPDEAEDLVQGFVADKILHDALLNKADRGRGKFRTFLLNCLDHYAISRHRREHADCRSPQVQEDWLPDEFVEKADQIPHKQTPIPALVDLAWIQEVIGEGLQRTHKDLEQSGRLSSWQIFSARVIGPILHGEKPESYLHLVKQFGFDSPAQASNALVTAKRVFERNFRAVIREYVRNEDEVNAEILDFRAVLADLDRIL